MSVSKLHVLVLLLALLAVRGAQAEAFMVYGTHDGYPKYYEEAGQAKGIVVDISKLCLDEMQVPYQIKLMPWARAYTLAERGGGGVIGLSMSEERLLLFDFSEPIFTEHIVLIVKKGREFTYEKIADLQGKLVGVSIGTSYGTAFDEAVANGSLTIVGFNDSRSGLAMLQRERIDAILMGSSVDIGKLVEGSPDLQGDTFAALPVPFKSDSKHMGIAKELKMGWFLQQFNQCLRRGHDAGAFDSIIYEYSN
ncbi:amino acid ABC transporter substrate-binding protein [Aquipseudomonas campi]|uniref:Amino acid ABC transporter substrate-binding protein n=1 Tax=Aquipseudomonas campi TaxID=2731681 RepID=A0A6M8G8V1_9GAMM|nr:transporter substrate-binding domain-containing protein [Pseudomonas campi]QKE65265.1 amino acid ABC transporter substrate-binding protein [Pseudomonas campi]